ncbi:DCN1-like protein 1 isoform X7 [Oopsacas minuta]|uniref:Defective in cullin neddylation protein n=1 Tax=Oopsacas minuta TaxID=111878 RepID=A0AAV7JVS3_9METZ|nr:DCN1-like protein 1 isoform X7 [Oopsacas minuta]
MSGKLKSSQRETVAQFRSVTACDEKSAINCLSQFDWKLDRSVDEFFQNQDKYIVHEPADFKKLALIFEKYKRTIQEREGDKMMATGITEFLNDLCLDPTSISVLIIAWKFKAKEQCVFTRTEFIEGMKNCGCDNIDKLKRKIPEFERELENSDKFKSFYQFAFEFAKNPDQRYLGR